MTECRFNPKLDCRQRLVNGCHPLFDFMSSVGVNRWQGYFVDG